MRYAPATRIFLVAGAVLSIIRAVGVIVFTHGLAFAVANYATDSLSRYEATAVVGLSVLVASQWIVDLVAIRFGIRVTSQLRTRALDSFRSVNSNHSSETADLLTTGVDAIAAYVSGFLPAVVATAVFTPIVAGAVWLIDPLSGLAVAVTIPLIPVFMALIGAATSATQTAQWAALSRLSVGFSEIIDGLTTLFLFGRERLQAKRIREVTSGVREQTMKVLRLSFLSSFALEVGASLAVAVVAVSIGIRLVNGDLELATGLWVLILVPEAFTAIRLVGARFHASADGLVVAQRVFSLIEKAPESANLVSVDESGLHVDRVSMDGRVRPVTFAASPGDVVTLTGPSGVGKSTLIDAIRGELSSEGVSRIDGRRVTLHDCSWSPQAPTLVGHSLEDAIRMGQKQLGNEEVLADAIVLAAIDVPLTRPISELSGGQTQRVALARAFFRALTLATPIIVLDEPTSALDEATEARVMKGIRELGNRGFIVLVVSHRPAVVEAADHVVVVGDR